jgi:hypothetical protein
VLNPYVLAGTHATHYLVSRWYLENAGGVADAPPGDPSWPASLRPPVLFEGYDHNYTDTEFIETARARGVFAPCLDAVVEHLHVVAGKAQWDETYRKGAARMGDDEVLFQQRRGLWGGPAGQPL